MASTSSTSAAKRACDMLVLVGPSGSGKSTLITRLMEEYPSRFGYSISHTTRDMRNGEVNGVSYHFVTPDEFRARLAAGEFLEHATVHDTYYGTSTGAIRDVMQKDQVALMDLDIVGARNVKSHPDFRTMVVWVVPPTFEILEKRLRDRGTDPEHRIVKRLADGREWWAWQRENSSFFDLCLVNGDFDACYKEFRAAVMSKCYGEEPEATSQCGPSSTENTPPRDGSQETLPTEQTSPEEVAPTTLVMST